MNVLIANCYYSLPLPVGSKVKFTDEKQSYTVRSSNVAFAVCTKPFNARKTVLYSVIDWHRNVRGTENLIFGMGAETDSECDEILERLTNGETEVSYRHVQALEIEKITLPNPKQICDDSKTHDLSVSEKPTNIDTERLNFLDKCNRRLNEHFGTSYGWELILNHNLTRLMSGAFEIDLNDFAAGNDKSVSCREAIDKKMNELSASKKELLLK